MVHLLVIFYHLQLYLLPFSNISLDLNRWSISGIPVSAGVYLFQIDRPGLRERIIKWFGVSKE